MNLLVDRFQPKLKTLTQQSPKLCVSLYMPIYKNKAKLYNLTRFKNLVRQAEELLGANRRNPVIALNILRPALTLLNDPNFWQSQSQGLAVFLADHQFYYYHLPIQLEELVVVADQFYLKPILLMSSGNQK